MSQLSKLIRETFPHALYREDEVTSCARHCFRCKCDAAAKKDDRELRELRYWKRASIREMDKIDLQHIGRILGLKVGDSIAEKIIPALLEKGYGKSHSGFQTARSAVSSHAS